VNKWFKNLTKERVVKTTNLEIILASISLGILMICLLSIVSLPSVAELLSELYSYNPAIYYNFIIYISPVCMFVVVIFYYSLTAEKKLRLINKRKRRRKKSSKK